ncbi:hypothetical protein GRF29_28g1261632 [Pseudopithomyces chartarum]|uniref:Uncharacterized protein n=1 Tax=Pseudopithomyces chartarum TaxID=1892770 RepID=A0AAN6M087_9PLEO|nr:hypothetical protein GRF29_28g1261632 [Pseudopithomyces chartarum]
MMNPSVLIAIELWIFISRVVTLGSFQRLQLDDWLMVVIVVPFTAMVATADGSDSFSTSTDAKRRLKMSQFLLDNQCSTYHNHSILVLILDATTITGTFILPVAFIPTPRKLLQITLIVLGTLILICGILARSFVITSPNAPTYLHWYTIQIVLMILFANLPFLISLFTSGTRTPRASMSLTSWPRSRTGSAGTIESNISTLYGSPRSISGDFPPVDFKDVWTDNRATPPTSPMRLWLRGRESVKEIDFNGLAQQQPPESA